jgi:hypothetical protein
MLRTGAMLRGQPYLILPAADVSTIDQALQCPLEGLLLGA